MKIRKTHLTSLLFILIACGEDMPTAKFVISGAVTENAQGVSGISILNGSSQVATTASDGTYSIEGLNAGTYVIKAEQSGRNFNPHEHTVILSDADADGIDFVRLPASELNHKGQTWSLLNPSVYSIKVNNSSVLQLDLVQNALWYEASQGGLIYQSVTGDFTITATVNAVRKSNNTQPVACNICLGGLMARSPSGTGENYVHLVTGIAPSGAGYETKNTTNNVSPFNSFPDGSTRHDLRIRRIGNSFILLQKLVTAAEWTVAATFDRPDLPATLQVGINIYTVPGGGVADLSVIYENIVVDL